MIIDGRQIAAEILARTRARVSRASRGAPLVVAIQGNDTPATRSYLAIKEKKAGEAGCRFEVRALGASYEDADAVIVQLPLADGVDSKPILDAIPIEKDADVLSSDARQRGDLLPPVVGAVREILKLGNVELQNKNAVVIGSGWLVGNPCAIWLKQQGANVEVLDRDSDIASALKNADIIISGAGSPHLIKPEYVKEGVVLIDAATSESNGVLAGDADPACAERCSLFTPVPGGVGPIAVACLFENAVTLAERAD